MKKKKYDLIIVGAGPSGVFCAYELIQKNKHQNILIIEQGNSIKKRVCPLEKCGKCMHCKPYCNITSGFSGAGAFSDGKLNSYHLSTGVPDNLYLGGNDGVSFRNALSVKAIKELFKYTDDVYLKFGASPELSGLSNMKKIQEFQNKAKKANLQLVYYPIRHIGTEKAHELYARIEDYLEKNGVQMLFNTSVEDLIVEDDKVVGVKTFSAFDKTKHKTFSADNVCLAVGRKGADWLEEMCAKYHIQSNTGAVDIGVRFELPDAVMEEVNKYFYEAKFIGTPDPFGDKTRTFCQNPSGFVANEVYDNNLTLVNGHSYKNKKSTNTNLAILVSHNFGKPFNKPTKYAINVAENLNQLGAGNIVVQRLGDIYRGKRTWEHELKSNSVRPTLKSAVAGDITYALGYRTLKNILSFIRSVDKVVQGFANQDNLVYGPEIKFYSNEIVLDKTFQTSIKNLYAIGDGSGQTTGLMMASAAGVQLARFMCEKF